jgi:hypothetical protein
LPKPSATVPETRSSSATAGAFAVIDLVPFEEEDESPFAGMLKVEAA